MSRPISVVFEGDESDAIRAFDHVGDSSRKMATAVDKSADSHSRLGEKIGNNERNFMGAADLLDGLGGAFGLPTEGATGLMRAFGDLSGGFEIVSGIMPMLTTAFPSLATAMTFVSAHPLMTAFLVGGAIIGGLILLETKFGLVSDAVKAMGGAFSWTWDTLIKPALNMMLGGLEFWMNAISTPVRLFSKLPGIPDLPTVKLPRLDVGGTVLQTGVAIVHRGEVVSPAGPSSFRPAGETVHNHFYIAGSVVSERDLVRVVRDGLARENRIGG
jgi:hypothetical protein